MDLDALTEIEINQLIKNLKNPKKLLDFDAIYDDLVNSFNPMNQKYKAELLDEQENIEYVLNVLETPIKTNFTIALRFQENPHHLLRFDFGQDKRHINNFNSDQAYTIVGSHIHIYSLPDKNSPKNVIPINDISEFKNVSILAEAFIKFIEYTNINYERR